MDNNLRKKLKVSLYYISGANIFTAIAMFLLYFETQNTLLIIAGLVLLAISAAFFWGSDKIIEMMLQNPNNKK